MSVFVKSENVRLEGVKSTAESVKYYVGECYRYRTVLDTEYNERPASESIPLREKFRLGT